MSAKLYRLSDKAISLLNKRTVRLFGQAKSKSLINIDELNIIGTMTQLYADLEKENERRFLELALLAYKSAGVHGNKPPTRRWVRETLSAYDDVLLFVYLNEVERKRDRAIEAVISAQDKSHEFAKAMRYWSRMTAWECDNVAYSATVKAFKDAGVKYVRWNTEKDERVCGSCGKLDKKVYPIDKVPKKPHPGCRCWLTPVEN